MATLRNEILDALLGYCISYDAAVEASCRVAKLVEAHYASTNKQIMPLPKGNCEGCRSFKRGRQWGMRCTDCIRSVDIVDNYSSATA
jgi:hypothetical protein